jgi:hypothetical protein
MVDMSKAAGPTELESLREHADKTGFPNRRPQGGRDANAVLD